MRTRSGRLSKLIVVSCVASLAGCGPSPQEQLANEALHNLENIDAATTVGVTYAQYHTLLAAAQVSIAQIEKSPKAVPGSRQLRLAMDGYVDAARIWDRTAAGKDYLFTCNSEQKELIEKYQMPLIEPINGCSQTVSASDSMKRLVWPQAHKELKTAAESIQSNPGTIQSIKRKLFGS